MRFHSLLLLSTLGFGLAACQAEPTTDEITASDDGKADSTTELRVRAGDTTLWLDPAIVRRGDTFVLSGRTSRDLVGGFPFIYEHENGVFTKKSARTFEVAWVREEVQQIAHGQGLYLRLDLKPSSTRPASVTAYVTLRARVEPSSGTGAYLWANATPVYSGGRIVWRVKGTAQSKIYSLRADAAGTALTDVKVLDDTHFQIDLQFDHLLAIAAGGELAVTVGLLSGSKVKRARIGLAVKKLGITTEDAYDVWPPIACEDDVKQCLAALPDGTLDLASCGEALAVQACLGSVGVTVDDVAIQAALARAPEMAETDAAALAGADKAAALAEAARLTVEERVQNEYGRVYADAAARDAALDALAAAALDDVYARPFDRIEQHTPIPGDAARTRDVAADALLLYLASADLRMTEWARPLEQLCREYRAQHVAALRDLRQVAPEGNVYMGNWLGAVVEVTVDPATGTVTNVFFEVD